MGYFAVVNESTGMVEKCLFHGDGSVPEPGAGERVVEIGAELYKSGAGLAFRDGRVVKEADTASAEEAWADLRLKRDRLLARTDWTQLPDVPDEIRAAYAPYRNALRDLPANTTDPLHPAWPVAPAL